MNKFLPSVYCFHLVRCRIFCRISFVSCCVEVFCHFSSFAGVHRTWHLSFKWMISFILYHRCFFVVVVDGCFFFSFLISFCRGAHYTMMIPFKRLIPPWVNAVSLCDSFTLTFNAWLIVICSLSLSFASFFSTIYSPSAAIMSLRSRTKYTTSTFLLLLIA